MPSFQVTVSGTMVLPLGAPVDRVVLTIQSGAAEVYATLDGTNPAAPTSSVNNDGVHLVPGVVGQGTALTAPVVAAAGAAGPPGRSNTTLRLASAGSPVVSVEW